MFYNPPSPTQANDDMWWRIQMSGMLRDITGQLLALTEVVQKIAERLEAEHNTGSDQESRGDA